jgi:hypothetical protein
MVAHDITQKKKQAKKIEESLNEKELLLKEIHHRVKNNLQIIGLPFNSDFKLELYDVQGKLIALPKLNVPENTLSFEETLPTGMFILTIRSSSESTSVIITKED